MKKLLLLLSICAMTIIGAQAQKLSKEEKAAQKERQEAEAQMLYAKLFNTTNFQFNPQYFESKTGGRNNINGYQYLKVRPDSFQVAMNGMPGIEVKEGFEITQNEVIKGSHKMMIKCSSNGANYTFDIVANPKSARTVIRVKSNKAEDVIYTGEVKAN